MASEFCLVDSNVLLRWTQSGDPSFATVVAAIERLERTNSIPCFVSQNLGEFWNVLTRPADKNGYGRLPEEADRLARVIETKFRLLPDSLAVHQEWRRLLIDYRVSGVQVHDARLVASMRVHGVKRILTFNSKDFERYKDIEAVHP
jgi:predicted nucleic acid-binding protein